MPRVRLESLTYVSFFRAKVILTKRVAQLEETGHADHRTDRDFRRDHARLDRGLSRGGYEPKVGERHPDFTLPTIGDRTPVSLSDFRGKKVLLIQFASW